MSHRQGIHIHSKLLIQDMILKKKNKKYRNSNKTELPRQWVVHLKVALSEGAVTVVGSTIP